MADEKSTEIPFADKKAEHGEEYGNNLKRSAKELGVLKVDENDKNQQVKTTINDAAKPEDRE